MLFREIGLESLLSYGCLCLLLISGCYWPHRNYLVIFLFPLIWPEGNWESFLNILKNSDVIPFGPGSLFWESLLINVSMSSIVIDLFKYSRLS